MEKESYIMAIHVTSPEDYEEVIRWAINQDMKWIAGGKEIHESYWYSYGFETCIIINNNNTISYADREYVNRNYDTDILDVARFYENARTYFNKKFIDKFDLK